MPYTWSDISHPQSVLQFNPNFNVNEQLRNHVDLYPNLGLNKTFGSYPDQLEVGF